jgi:hypothetical protein
MGRWLRIKIVAGDIGLRKQHEIQRFVAWLEHLDEPAEVSNA